MTKPVGHFMCCKCSLEFSRENYMANPKGGSGCPSCGNRWVKWLNYIQIFKRKFK